MLEVSQLIAHLRFTAPANLQYWMGSAFRGAFGRNLRQICCVDFSRNCIQCSMNESCLFYYIFFRDKSKRGYSAPVKPVILIPPFFGKEMYFKENGTLDLGILIFGNFRKFLPHVVFGLSLAGKRGICSIRYENCNRFIVNSILTKRDGRVIFDGENINLNNFRPVDITKINGLNGKSFRVMFKTPFTARDFPPDAETFIKLVRNRLIRFVNEYGTQEKVPDFIAEGEIESIKKHFHRLRRRSSRSNKTTFESHTGIIVYKYSFLDASARWLLSIAPIIGCGPDASFGCGFLDIQKVN
ncbi:MAG: hypothetical protein ACTSO9_13985 [Candidatus Helarchaeota archaeon]